MHGYNRYDEHVERRRTGIDFAMTLSSEVLKRICFQKKDKNRSAINIGTRFDTSSMISVAI